MGNYVGGKSAAERSAEKIVKAMETQRFPWWPTIITSLISGVVGGVLVWVVQAHSERQRRETDIATSVAITVANDLRLSTGVSQATRDRLIKRQIKSDTGMFVAIYSPTVDLPPSGDAAVLKPSVLSALDEYRRRLGECAKHRQMLIDEWQVNSPPPNGKGIILTYCVSLDSVVRSGLILLDAIEADYPTVKKVITKPSGYRPIENDMPEIQKVLNDPSI